MFPSSTPWGKKDPSHHPCCGSVMLCSSSFVWLLEVPYKPLCSEAPTTEGSFQYCHLHRVGYLQLFQDPSLEPRCPQWSSWTKWSWISIACHLWETVNGSVVLFLGYSVEEAQCWSAEARTAQLGELSEEPACWEHPHSPWKYTCRAEASLTAGDPQGRLSSCLFQPDHKLQKCT